MEYPDQKRFFVRNEVGIIMDIPPCILTQDRVSIKDTILYFVESRTKKGDLQLEFFSPKKLPVVKIVPVIIDHPPQKEDICLFEASGLYIIRRLSDVVEDALQALSRQNMGRAYRKIEDLCLHLANVGDIKAEKEVIKKMAVLNNLKERFYRTDQEGERSNCKSLFERHAGIFVENLIDI